VTRYDAPTHPHPIYSQDSVVVLTSGNDRLDALHAAARQAGFVPILLAQWQASGKPKEDFRIAIKPNIMTAAVHRKTPPCTPIRPGGGTDRPDARRGLQPVHVVEAQNVYNYSFTGRRVPEVAAMCGYTGEGYAIVDLSEDTIAHDYGGALGQHKVGRVWAEADYRISFAKNKTHWQCYYTACLKNIYGCLPEWDKMLHYHASTSISTRPAS
jgi:hypothetical protein